MPASKPRASEMIFRPLAVSNPILLQMHRDRIEDQLTRIAIAIFSASGIGFCAGVALARFS